MGDWVLEFDDDRADLATVGGKGAALARLARAGLPVPTGFHVTTAAFHQRDAAIPAIRAAYRGGPVAVRSSATTEDVAGMSSAGQHDSFLWVEGEDALVDAVRRCWASADTERAIAYRARHGLAEVELAVVVQEMVDADAAGVLFTANPLTGDRTQTVVDAAWGLGETVVGGQVTPDSHVLDADGREVGGRVGDKAVMAVRAEGGGTRLVDVPAERRARPVLDADDLAALAELGRRVQDVVGEPVDIEWARRADGRFALVQARPITGLAEVWNDSLRGDYLWTNGNVGEAVPGVMTPATWSFVSALALPPIDGHPMAGNIGGRFYLNLSLYHAVGAAFGLRRLVAKAAEGTFGRAPVEVPSIRLSRVAVLKAAVPFARQGAVYKKALPVLLRENPARCATLHERIAEADLAGLRSLWTSDVDELLNRTAPTLDAGARMGGPGRVRGVLSRLVGEADATTLMTGLHGDDGELASLGPLVGLARLRDGEIDRAAYAAAWGHRGPDEFELSAPRPAEDPAWLDRLVAEADDPHALLDRQAAARAQAWQRLTDRHPRKVARVRKLLERAAANARARELARSELIRVVGVLRAYLLRASALTGADLFFLSFPETVAVLGGDRAPLAAIPGRQAAYARYRSLPPYPPLIRGAFDPFARPEPVGEGVITGFPGVPGVVEGVARVVLDVADGAALRSGEILVTSVTNIGWTPLFPRAAAVVTDVGAPLSHAAIVARELGIPAVVGCGDATARLATGDRVVVDGARGTVTRLG